MNAPSTRELFRILTSSTIEMAMIVVGMKTDRDVSGSERHASVAVSSRGETKDLRRVRERGRERDEEKERGKVFEADERTRMRSMQADRI